MTHSFFQELLGPSGAPRAERIDRLSRGFCEDDRDPSQLRRRAPRVGEHNEEIYVREMGISHMNSRP